MPPIVTEVADPAAGSETGIGGAAGLNSASDAGPRPVPKMLMISPGVIVPCLKLA